MDGRVALVTGSTSGIGSAIARRLVDDGFSVVITGTDVRRGTELREGLGQRAHFLPADLRLEGSAESLVSGTLAWAGRLDVLVNNAAVDHARDLLEVGEAEIRSVLDVNTVAPMSVLIAAACAMRSRGEGGAIINVTSRLASIGVATMGVYGASKGAMLAFTRAAAVELAPLGVRVNAVAPGMTRTPLYDQWIAQCEDPISHAEGVLRDIPLGRLGEPEDVAGVVSFLAGPDAAYVTGVSIPVDGGYVAR